MAEDTLGKLSPPDVAAFYARLADAVDQKKGALTVSLAAMLMRLWLKNRDHRRMADHGSAPDRPGRGGPESPTLGRGSGEGDHPSRPDRPGHCRGRGRA